MEKPVKMMCEMLAAFLVENLNFQNVSSARAKVHLREEGLESLITPVNAHVRNMDVISDENVDLVVSNETLCELDRNGLEMALREFYRILKSGGQMMHGELIQAFENDAQ